MNKGQKIDQIIENDGVCSLGGLGSESYVSCVGCPLISLDGDVCQAGTYEDKLALAKDIKQKERKPSAKAQPSLVPTELNKREKWEARIDSFEKEKEEAFSCCYDGREIGVYVNGEYSTNSTCNPEEALVFAKWIINLEGK